MTPSQVRYQAALHSDANGGEEGNRTPDTEIFSLLLYQLSYLAVSYRLFRRFVPTQYHAPSLVSTAIFAAVMKAVMNMP